MKYIINRRTFATVGWICACAIICSQLSVFTPNVAAQEPADTPTPTATATTTPVLAPAADTPTPTATTVSRLVDFRVDDNKIEEGKCATFSWVVRGDIDRIEFDMLEDDKSPILVSAMDTRQECPGGDADYEFIVSWLDGTRTVRQVEIEVTENDDGGGNGSEQTSAPGGAGSFVPVTPVPFGSSQQQTGNVAPSGAPSDGTVVTPVGALGSVSVLPETGAPPFPTADVADAHPSLRLSLALVVGLATLLGISAIAGLTVLARVRPKS